MGKKATLPSIKIAIVGSSSVGKYSLSQQYAKGWIEPKETNKSPTANCPSKEVQLEHHKYEIKAAVCQDLNEEALQGCDGVVLVYSVVDKNSFTYVKTVAYQKLYEKFGTSKAGETGVSNDAAENSQSASTENKLQEVAETPTGTPADTGLTIPVILVGNKVDDAKLSRQIEPDVAESLSRELSCVGFFETAATCNANVPKAFTCLLTEITNRRVKSGDMEQKKKSNACCVIS